MWLRHCLICQQQQRFYCCVSCWQKIAPYQAPYWSKTLGSGGFPCISYTPYTKEIQQLLYFIKYHDFKGLASECGRRLGEWYLKNWPLPDYVIAIPLHDSRQKERGYNQSWLLAQALAKVIQRPAVPLLMRIQDTPRLYNFNPHQRADLMKDAFVVSSSIIKKRKKYYGASYLIVDDIFTTGSTMESAFKAMSEVSQRSVSLTLARADITELLDFGDV